MKLNQSIKINHPMADSISVQDSEYHHCVPGESSEIAFFKDSAFVVAPIEPFTLYHDGSDASVHDTAVYDYVPNELIDEFLNKYQA